MNQGTSQSASATVFELVQLCTLHFNQVVRFCVFCGSSIGRNPSFTKAAQVLATELARRGIEIVYGGSLGALRCARCARVRSGALYPERNELTLL